MKRSHQYIVNVRWTGNKGTGTDGYNNYERSHVIKISGKMEIPGSSDPAFRGDSTRHNPEDLFVASVSACHMLWYLHLCADEGVIVTDYIDNASGTLLESAEGGGKFEEVTLNPVVKVKTEAMIALANGLHKKAAELCFLANSVNFPVHHNPTAEYE